MFQLLRLQVASALSNVCWSALFLKTVSVLYMFFPLSANILTLVICMFCSLFSFKYLFNCHLCSEAFLDHLIYTDYLLMVVFRPLIFSVIIDITGFKSTPLLFIFNLSHLFSVPFHLPSCFLLYIEKHFLCSSLAIFHGVCLF